jgi:hypothetical protein
LLLDFPAYPSWSVEGRRMMTLWGIVAVMAGGASAAFWIGSAVVSIRGAVKLDSGGLPPVGPTPIGLMQEHLRPLGRAAWLNGIAAFFAGVTAIAGVGQSLTGVGLGPDTKVAGCRLEAMRVYAHSADEPRKEAETTYIVTCMNAQGYFLAGCPKVSSDFAALQGQCYVANSLWASLGF